MPKLETFTLYSADLYEKYGFSDGDLFDDWLDSHLVSSDDELNPKELLVAAVRATLLPQLKPAIRVVEVRTGYNPLRAYSEFSGEARVRLEPEYVVITEQQLVDLFPTKLSLETVR